MNTKAHKQNTHMKFRVKWWRQRLASTPLAVSTQSTGHNWERKQISWPWHAGERGGVRRKKERSPQFQIIPSYSAGWLTSFPIAAGEEDREGVTKQHQVWGKVSLEGNEVKKRGTVKKPALSESSYKSVCKGLFERSAAI